MQPLVDCGSSLVVLIETQQRDWTWFYNIVKNVRIKMSNNPHRHPIPYGTEITDHVQRNMDEISIQGVIGCLSCDFINADYYSVISALKQLKERMMYSTDDFVTLTSNHWQARYMILKDVEVEESQDRVHTKMITTTWIGANLTGTIRNPDFERGGII